VSSRKNIFPYNTFGDAILWKNALGYLEIKLKLLSYPKLFNKNLSSIIQVAAHLVFELTKAFNY